MNEKRDTSGLYNRIVMLSKVKYGSVNKMLKACNLPKSTVDNIKNGSMPSSDKLSAIANSFGVSTDYLLSGDNNGGGIAFTIDKDVVRQAISSVSKKISNNIEEQMSVDTAKKEPSPPDNRWKRYEDQINELPESSQERLMKQIQAMIEIEKELRNEKQS